MTEGLVAAEADRERFGLDRGSKREIVCVQGLGFVGAAMAAAIASARGPDGEPCFDVIGVELDTGEGARRAKALRNGKFPFASPDQKLAAAVFSAFEKGNLSATCDEGAFALARYAVVDVPMNVSIGETGMPVADVAPFESAIEALGRNLSADSLVIVETTVAPGTCENVVAPALARCLAKRGLPGDAIGLAHSYERVMPGPGYFDSVVNFWRVYAGHTNSAAEECERFLRKVINVDLFPLRRLGSTTASETAKVLENSYRAVNIAFIEEWSRFAEAAGIDLFEVIGAVRDRPTHDNIRQPGFGVGGYCLPKDLLFAETASIQYLNEPGLNFPFCRMAEATNRRMPLANLERIERLGGGLSGKQILLLGIAYRSEVDDTRYAPAEAFYREAVEKGAQIVCHDPYVRYWHELGIAIPAKLPDPKDADIVVLAVPHACYRELDLLNWLGPARPLVYDADNFLADDARSRLRDAGIRVESTGRGLGL